MTVIAEKHPVTVRERGLPHSFTAVKTLEFHDSGSFIERLETQGLDWPQLSFSQEANATRLVGQRVTGSSRAAKLINY